MWDIYQEMRINDLRQQQVDNDAKTRSAAGDLRDLERQVSKIALVSQALYELLQERVGVTDEELRRKIREVDRRDGVEDGRLTTEPLVCPQCRAKVTAGALSCQSCGATVAPRYPYED